MINFLEKDKLMHSERLELVKLFIRFMKEKHVFKNTLYAYNFNNKHKINNFDDLFRKVRIDTPYMSMFDMTYIALVLGLNENYFYKVNYEWNKLSDLYFNIKNISTL